MITLLHIYLKIDTQAQHFFFCETYRWPNKPLQAYYNKLERLARDKHLGLLSPFVSYEENELW